VAEFESGGGGGKIDGGGESAPWFCHDFDQIDQSRFLVLGPLTVRSAESSSPWALSLVLPHKLSTLSLNFVFNIINASTTNLKTTAADDQSLGVVGYNPQRLLQVSNVACCVV
jgi:hypothetical protein